MADSEGRVFERAPQARGPGWMSLSRREVSGAAVTNAVLHGADLRIEIQVDVAADVLRLEVRDDGRGFTPYAADEARRQGTSG